MIWDNSMIISYKCLKWSLWFWIWWGQYGQIQGAHFSQPFGFVNQSDENALILVTGHKSKTAAIRTSPCVSRTNIKNPANYVEQISVLNSDDLNRTILLSPSFAAGCWGATALDVTRGFLVLKRIALWIPSVVTIRGIRVAPVLFTTSYRTNITSSTTTAGSFTDHQLLSGEAFNRDSKAILNRMKQLDEDTSP